MRGQDGEIGSMCAMKGRRLAINWVRIRGQNVENAVGKGKKHETMRRSHSASIESIMWSWLMGSFYHDFYKQNNGHNTLLAWGGGGVVCFVTH